MAKVGDLLLDITHMESFLEDLPEGATVGLMPEKEELTETLNELYANQEAYGAEAGIDESDLAFVKERTAQIEKIDEALEVHAKMGELMLETRAKRVHEREEKLHALARVVESRAESKKNPELLARYQGLRRYRSATALKGVKTRRRNAKAATDAAPTEKK